MSRRYTVGCCAILLSGTGCLDHELAASQGEEFVAFQSDFAGFQDWESSYVGDGSLGDSLLVGRRTVYWNQEPPAGSEAFPNGTIIVKTTEVSEDPLEWVIFAMVKRGGGYNADGAADWEWFDLVFTDSGGVAIDWRGVGPPSGQGYAGDLGTDTGAAALITDCNTCHAAAWDNDYVLTPALQLSES
jgi:hypothetical protein